MGDDSDYSAAVVLSRLFDRSCHPSVSMGRSSTMSDQNSSKIDSMMCKEDIRKLPSLTTMLKRIEDGQLSPLPKSDRSHNSYDDDMSSSGNKFMPRTSSFENKHIFRQQSTEKYCFSSQRDTPLTFMPEERHFMREESKPVPRLKPYSEVVDADRRYDYGSERHYETPLKNFDYEMSKNSHGYERSPTEPEHESQKPIYYPMRKRAMSIEDVNITRSPELRRGPRSSEHRFYEKERHRYSNYYEEQAKAYERDYRNREKHQSNNSTNGYHAEEYKPVNKFIDYKHEDEYRRSSKYDENGNEHKVKFAKLFAMIPVVNPPSEKRSFPQYQLPCQAAPLRKVKGSDWRRIEAVKRKRKHGKFAKEPPSYLPITVIQS